MKNEIEMTDEKYFRVGTTLYKQVLRPLISADFIEEKIPWSYETLRQDFSKDSMPYIEKYDGFCIIPNHTNFQQSYGKFLNQYHEISHKPSPGNFSHIKIFLEHIFKEQIELGYDYIQLLYTQPIQMLPILLLVSSERQTGKTTFIRFIKMIFEKNATFNSNQDFQSQFNSDWVNRLVILVDELMLNKMENTEMLKNLSTAGEYKMEGKNKDRKEVEFFAKFIMCSNNELNPIIIPTEEVRFWVRKIQKSKNDNISLREQMGREIPQFLHFLLNRKLSTRNESRMWFKPSLLETPALRKIKRYNTNKIEVEMASYCKDVMEAKELNKMMCCAKDFMPVISDTGLKTDISHIRNILKDSWCLNSEHNGEYTFYLINKDGELTPMKRKGRYVIVTLEFVNKILL